MSTVNLTLESSAVSYLKVVAKIKFLYAVNSKSIFMYVSKLQGKYSFLKPRIFIAVNLLLFIPALVFSQTVLVPEAGVAAAIYHQLSNLIWISNIVLALLVSLAFLYFGWGLKVLEFIEIRMSKRKYLLMLVFAAFYYLVQWAIRLPLLRIRSNSFYKLTSAESDSVLKWSGIQLADSLSFGVILILVTLLLFWLINKSPKNWWLWTWGLFSVFSFLFLIGEPLLKNYEPIGNSIIELKIAEIAKRASIPLSSIVLESGGVDGHVIGLGPTRQIILNKDLFSTRDEKWTIQTIAHEAKHFVKDDNVKGFFAITLFLFVMLLILKVVSHLILKKYSNTLGFNAINQPAFLPLAFFIVTFTYLIAQPGLNKFRQHVEFEADRFGLELTHENNAQGQMVASWATEFKGRVSKPSHFYMLFRSSHPSDAERINFANTYFPWKEGKPLVYEKDILPRK